MGCVGYCCSSKRLLDVVVAATAVPHGRGQQLRSLAAQDLAVLRGTAWGVYIFKAPYPRVSYFPLSFLLMI